jgi:hypothetical protein
MLAYIQLGVSIMLLLLMLWNGGKLQALLDNWQEFHEGGTEEEVEGATDLMGFRSETAPPLSEEGEWIPYEYQPPEPATYE